MTKPKRVGHTFTWAELQLLLEGLDSISESLGAESPEQNKLYLKLENMQKKVRVSR